MSIYLLRRLGRAAAWVALASVPLSAAKPAPIHIPPTKLSVLMGKTLHDITPPLSTPIDPATMGLNLNRLVSLNPKSGRSIAAIGIMAAIVEPARITRLAEIIGGKERGDQIIGELYALAERVDAVQGLPAVGAALAQGLATISQRTDIRSEAVYYAIFDGARSPMHSPIQKDFAIPLPPDAASTAIDALVRLEKPLELRFDDSRLRLLDATPTGGTQAADDAGTVKRLVGAGDLHVWRESDGAVYAKPTPLGRLQKYVVDLAFLKSEGGYLAERIPDVTREIEKYIYQSGNADLSKDWKALIHIETGVRLRHRQMLEAQGRVLFGAGQEGTDGLSFLLAALRQITIPTPPGLSFSEIVRDPIVYRTANKQEVLITGDFSAAIANRGLAFRYDDERKHFVLSVRTLRAKRSFGKPLDQLVESAQAMADLPPQDRRQAGSRWAEKKTALLETIGDDALRAFADRVLTAVEPASP